MGLSRAVLSLARILYLFIALINREMFFHELLFTLKMHDPLHWFSVRENTTEGAS